MKILVFDTETTGVPKDRRASPSDTDAWPHIVQLSYITYHVESATIQSAGDHLVKLPTGVALPPESTAIHGITMLQLKRKGVSAEVALSEFCRELSSVDWIVAHNIEFDRQVTRAACYRLGLADPFERIGHGLREFCTMQMGRALCGIWASRRNGSRYIKYPTLHELHLELFESGADNLHDALADVLVCLRCYLKMQHEHDMMTCDRARQLYSLYGIGSTQKEK